MTDWVGDRIPRYSTWAAVVSVRRHPLRKFPPMPVLNMIEPKITRPTPATILAVFPPISQKTTGTATANGTMEPRAPVNKSNVREAKKATLQIARRLPFHTKLKDMMPVTAANLPTPVLLSAPEECSNQLPACWHFSRSNGFNSAWPKSKEFRPTIKNTAKPRTMISQLNWIIRST